MSLVKQYLGEIWQGLGYHAAWLPNEPLKLGDVGRVVDGRFEQLTTLQDLGIDLPSAASGQELDLHYISKDGSAVTFKPQAAVMETATFTVQVRMKREGAVVFAAKSCRTTRIGDREALRRQLRDLKAIGGWDMSYAVLTELVTTGPVTILVSNSESAEVELSAEGAVDSVLGLADASLGLKVRTSTGLAAQILAATSLTPLFALSGLRRKLLGGVEITKRSGAPSGDEWTLELEDLSPEGVRAP